MELVLSLACEDARTREDGKLDVTGIFNELTAPGFPAAQERMVVVFVLEWDEPESGRQPLRADLLDDAGHTILTIQGHTDVNPRPDGGPSHTRLVMPLENVVFPHSGHYHFQLRAGEQTRRAFSLFVGEAA